MEVLMGKGRASISMDLELGVGRMLSLLILDD